MAESDVDRAPWRVARRATPCRDRRESRRENSSSIRSARARDRAIDREARTRGCEASRSGRGECQRCCSRWTACGRRARRSSPADRLFERGDRLGIVLFVVRARALAVLPQRRQRRRRRLCQYFRIAHGLQRLAELAAKRARRAIDGGNHLGGILRRLLIGGQLLAGGADDSRGDDIAPARSDRRHLAGDDRLDALALGQFLRDVERQPCPLGFCIRWSACPTRSGRALERHATAPIQCGCLRPPRRRASNRSAAT